MLPLDKAKLAASSWLYPNCDSAFKDEEGEHCANNSFEK